MKKLLLLTILSAFIFSCENKATDLVIGSTLGNDGESSEIESLDGVIDAVSGYANGYGVSPNYRSIIQLKNKYNENNFGVE